MSSYATHALSALAGAALVYTAMSLRGELGGGGAGLGSKFAAGEGGGGGASWASNGVSTSSSGSLFRAVRARPPVEPTRDTGHRCAAARAHTLAGGGRGRRRAWART